jgi:transposase InsO family protein
MVRKKRTASWYTPLPKPLVLSPGSLIQMDTIHFVRKDNTRFYVYALIDVYSRLAYAEYHSQLSQQRSVTILLSAQTYFGFPFQMVQTDNGPEFKDGFLVSLARNNIKLRHSRIRKPNDNAHIERFNRTIQEECFNSFLPQEDKIKEELVIYLEYYNKHRLHLALIGLLITSVRNNARTKYTASFLNYILPIDVWNLSYTMF